MRKATILVDSDELQTVTIDHENLLFEGKSQSIIKMVAWSRKLFRSSSRRNTRRSEKAIGGQP